MIIFQGNIEAARRKEALKRVIQEKYSNNTQLRIFSLVFQEDIPSTIYTKLKKKDALEVGIQYEDVYLPISTPIAKIQEIVKNASGRMDVHGIIIQKPAKALTPTTHWWHEVVSVLNTQKDVDGLTGKSKVLPATAKAILEIVQIAVRETKVQLKNARVVVLGRSDIVGKPVAQKLEEMGIQVDLFGRQEFANEQEKIKVADIIISATGQERLVTAQMLKPGVICIDAGSPKPEIDPTGLDSVASFLSPVPGGVGPMTRVCLLENLIDMLE